MAAFAAAAFMAFSCSNDDNQTTDTPALQGKWKLTSATAQRAFDGNGDGTLSTDMLAELGSCYADSYLEFGSGNTIKSFMSLVPSEGTACTTTTEEGTYKMVQYKVESTFVHTDGTKDHATYVKTGNLLMLSIPGIYQVEADDDGDGVTNTVTLNAKMIFTKE